MKPLTTTTTSLLLIVLWSSLATGQLPATGGNRQNRELFKGFSGFRLYQNSFRMVYFHDLTVAVVEIGDNMTLLNCELIEVFTDQQREQILKDLSKIVGRPLKLPFGDMMELMTQCEDLDPKIINKRIEASRPPVNAGADDASTESPVLSGILPGTKWCGTGDIAKNYFDLGSEWLMDKCCRKHDLCPVKVRANGVRYNLSNKSLYTKSHCICDDELAKCLKRANKRAADFMGTIYFNVLSVQCIAEGKNGSKIYRSAKNY